MAIRDYLHEDDYAFLFLSQNGKCAICGKSQEELDKSLAVDHDHNTMEVRGLLCTSCNLGLGAFSDSPVLLKKAIHYLIGNTGIYLSEVPITYKPSQESKSDWRTIQKDYEHILSASIADLMREYNISKATAYNWKANARLNCPST